MGSFDESSEIVNGIVTSNILKRKNSSLEINSFIQGHTKKVLRFPCTDQQWVC